MHLKAKGSASCASTPRMRSSNWLPSENEDIQLKTSRQVMKCDSFWCARRVPLLTK